MSKIPAINEIDANSPSQESKEVVIKATDVSPDVNEIQETISGAATIQEVDGTRKPTISEIYKIVTDGLFESTSNWWDYAYKLSQAQINQDIIARLDRGEIGGGYSKGVDIITTTSNKIPSNTNVYSALKSDALYPKKLNNETINGIYNFINGITIGKPTAYTGGTWSIDQLGKTHLTTDYLYVRLKAIFETLQILNVDTIGGKLVISPAGSINIVYVDNIKVTIDGNEQNVYRCYFLGEQEGEEIENKWKVGDQAQAKSFNVKKGTYHKIGNHYLWRLVVGASTDTVTIDSKKYHYVDLSQLIFDVGSDAPAPGDVLNQLGHRGDDLQRQTAIVLNAVDNYAPSITLYAGINDFTLLNKEYVEYGVYQGKAFFNVYGDMYIGDKGDNPTTYIKYKNGKIDIKANLTIGSSIDGKDFDKYIKENGGVDEETVKSLINNAQVIKDLQNQADGAIETWFYEGEPTLNNLPAVDWATNEIKKIHVGDLYYDQITGFAYRFTRYNDDVNPYAWNRIKDNDIVEALEAANNAQITADGKMKIFYNTKPTDYQVGDVWILPADAIINGVQYYKGDILTATVKSTEFNEKHWIKKVRYIGSKELNDNIDKVNKKINDISATTLPGLNDKFNEFAKDGILDSSEKARLTDLLNQANNEVLSVNEQITNIIKSDYLTNDNINKDKLIKAQTTLSTAWTEYKTLIDTLISSTNTITKNNIAEASSKYTNLQNSIKAVKQYLAACQADILSNIGIDISSYKYLKEAFKGKTEINGGLVVTNVLQLRQTSDVNSPITAGISGLQGKADENGVVDKDTYDITSIAAWFGGPMVDKDIFTDEQLKNKVAGTDYARSLFRHDGSGYLASGAIYWGTDGILHGNPNSFILQGTSLATMFNYVRLFYLHYANNQGEGITGVDYITPTKTFSRLDILTQGGTEAGLNLPTGLFIGSSTTGGSFQVGNVIIRTKNGDPNILEIVSASSNKTVHLGVQGGVSAYGTYTSSTGGGGGLNATVVSYANIIAGNYNDTDFTTIPNAYSIKALYTAIQNIDVTSQLGNYLLKTDAANIYQPKGNYLTTHQTIYGLTIQKNGANVGTYNPKTKATTINVTVPTKISELSNDSGYTDNIGTVTSVGISVPTGLSVTNSPITTKGIINIAFAEGYSIPTVAKQTSWDGAVNVKHTHANKTVLDGISSSKVTNWDNVYNWYVLMTTNEENTDGIINKWNEVVSFLANIAQTDTLSGIVDGINKSISDEVTRAKKAEGVNASGISTNKTNITTLQSYFTNGSAKKALQLTNARKLWGNSFNGIADINGSIIVPSGKYISIGNIKMEYDATNKALKITNTTTDEVANLYTSGGVSAYGVGTSSSSSGGLNGSVKSYADALKLASESLSEIASAYSIKALDSRIVSLEGGSAMDVSVSGSGNAVTAISKNGTTISVVKGSTFLTSHQSLSAYLKSADAANTYSKLGHTHSYAGSASAGGDATRTLKIKDYNGSYDIYCGFGGDGLLSSEITHMVGIKYVNNTVYYKDVAKAELKKWLGLGDRAYDSTTYLPTTGGTLTGNLNGTTAVFCGRIYGSGDDEGILIKPSNDGYAALILGSTDSDRSCFYLSSNNAFWSYVKGGTSANILHPHKEGTIALISDIPTKVSSLSNDSGYITSSGSCAYATSAGNADTVDGVHANGLLTALSNSDNGISITVGGTTKSVSNISVNHASSADNADLLDGAHLIKNGNGTGIKQVYYFNLQGGNSSYIKLGTLSTVSVTGLGTSKVMFTVKGGINIGGTNESVYEVAASTRGSIQVTSTLVRGYRELKFGYVSTSSNVEIWMVHDGTYRGVTEVEVSSSVNFALAMTETTTKPSGFVEGSYRILASIADNVASATKLQTPRTIWGQSFDGTADITGVMTINPPTIYDGSDNTLMFKVYSSTGYKNGLAISSTDNVTRLYAKPFGSGTRNALEIHTYNNTDVNAVIIDAPGNVGIGTTSPTTKLHVVGNILATGGVTAYQSSDVRLKTNITKLNCLKVIKSIGGTYEFDYIRDRKHSIGFIAQNVNNPLLNDIVAKDDNGYLKINYWSPKLIATAFGAIEQVDDEVSKLKARVKHLESEVERLTNDNRKLEATNNKLLISK